MMLRWLQQTGHKPIALMGGGTTKVGDPSGKDESAQAADRRAHRRQHRRASAGVFAKFLRFGDGADRRRHGRQRRLADQAQLHRVPARRRPAFLGQPHADVRFGEAAARARAAADLPRIQLHDPAGLRLRRAGARATAAALQMGGSDQWGNIVNGIDLGRRMGDAAAVRADHAAAHHRRRAPRWARPRPARSGSTPTCCRPYDYWQYWRNTEDADVGRFLKLFTDLPLDEIARLAALQGARDQRGEEGPGDRGHRLCRGDEAALTAEATAAATFNDGGVGADLPALPLPPEGIGLIDALVGLGFAASRGEAKRLISGGGALSTRRRGDRRRPSHRCKRERNQAVRRQEKHGVLRSS